MLKEHLQNVSLLLLFLLLCGSFNGTRRLWNMGTFRKSFRKLRMPERPSHIFLGHCVCVNLHDADYLPELSFMALQHCLSEHNNL